ncbi:TetR/AcrR family transcriptional regulator [Pararhizobium haloflavum]|uniref:TetR/AcrR family transcriptional regulator n=1 Tax=Pararhizobium haloflavum TaxID=2037914 RepID=UPI000C179C12|nr:TetR/AcrR family transcriptional regulator [Pararhizobium haloflavum]
MPPVARNSRTRILEAAEALAREVGPGNLSLDAVAQRAGLSKGGLLYNFPTKAKLMEALVEHHVTRSRKALLVSRDAHAGKPNALARALIDVFKIECAEKGPRPSGVLAAIAENPGFLEPVRRHQQQMAAELKALSDDPDLACIVFLAVEGLRSQRLFEIDLFSEAESERLMDRLARLVEEQRPAGPGVTAP